MMPSYLKSGKGSNRRRKDNDFMGGCELNRILSQPCQKIFIYEQNQNNKKKMEISMEFSVGDEPLIEFKNAKGYEDLPCKVKVTEGGRLGCVSVNGVAEKCKRTTPPYISFPADFTVKGWLKLKKTERVKRTIRKYGPLIVWEVVKEYGYEIVERVKDLFISLLKRRKDGIT